jgi:hypothetical protein
MTNTHFLEKFNTNVSIVEQYRGDVGVDAAAINAELVEVGVVDVGRWTCNGGGETCRQRRGKGKVPRGGFTKCERQVPIQKIVGRSRKTISRRVPTTTRKHSPLHIT